MLLSKINLFMKTNSLQLIHRLLTFYSIIFTLSFGYISFQNLFDTNSLIFFLLFLPVVYYFVRLIIAKVSKNLHRRFHLHFTSSDRTTPFSLEVFFDQDNAFFQPTLLLLSLYLFVTCLVYSLRIL